MKKFFFFAVLASTVLASCTKITPEIAVVDNNDNELPITFKAVNYVSQTKADFPTDESFGAYAWFNASATPDFMNNQEITNQSGTWKANGQTYYWPKSGTLDFVAYAPFKASPWVAVAKDSLKATDRTIEASDDYLYSDKAVSMTYNKATAGVPMTFHHALARICVKAKAAKLSNATDSKEADVNWSIKISSVKIDSVAKTGSVKLTLNATDTTKWDLPTGNVWTASTFESVYDGVAVDSLTTAVDTLIATTSVLPQELTHGDNKAALHIKYSITTKMKSGTQITENFDKEIPLTTIASAITSWGINKSIVYTLVIDPLAEGGGQHEITFVPSVTDWESETPADFNVSEQ